MATARFLHRAPITEALIDIRVPPNPEISAASFGELHALLAESYPQVNEIQAKQAVIRIEGGKLSATTTDAGVPGVHFRTADGRTVAQFRSDGFTLNRLAPYTRWEELLPQVERLWSLYVDRARPRQVLRVALRYINHMKLPIHTGENLGEYLTASPDIPDELPQSISSFLTRMSIHDNQNLVAANIVQSMGAAATGEQPATILLDIDAFRTDDLTLDFEHLRPILETLREFKNRIFFSLLTERTVRGFE